MSYLLVEYLCRGCGERYESLETRSAVPPSQPHSPCGSPADRVISAVKSRTCYATAVTRAKGDGPPGPNALDTRLLGEGMPVNEWKAKRRKLRIDRRHAANRRALA